MRLHAVFIVLVMLVFQWNAYAASGDVASAVDPHYSAVADGRTTYLICDGVSNAGGQTSCQPSSCPWTKLKGCTNAVFKIGKAQATCVTGDVVLRESDSFTVGAPNVWDQIAKVTGVADPLISAAEIGRMPKCAVRAEFSALPAQCTDVDFVLTMICP